MSANNLILINKKTFHVFECDADTNYRSLIQKAENLEDAIDIAEEYMEENLVEYGIHFTTAT